MLRRFRARRRLRRLVRIEADRLRPILGDLRADADHAARNFREAGAELPGFPPNCSACGRGMVAKRAQVSKKRWRWLWHCGSGRCYETRPYRKVQIEKPKLDV